MAYIPTQTAVLLFEHFSNQVVAAINFNPADLKTFEGIESCTLRTTDTTRTALQTMAAQNIDTLPVVDEGNVVVGVITWNQVITRMMLELVGNLATSTSD